MLVFLIGCSIDRPDINTFCCMYIFLVDINFIYKCCSQQLLFIFLVYAQMLLSVTRQKPLFWYHISHYTFMYISYEPTTILLESNYKQTLLKHQHTLDPSSAMHAQAASLTA